MDPHVIKLSYCEQIYPRLITQTSTACTQATHHTNDRHVIKLSDQPLTAPRHANLTSNCLDQPLSHTTSTHVQSDEIRQPLLSVAKLNNCAGRHVVKLTHCAYQPRIPDTPYCLQNPRDLISSRLRRPLRLYIVVTQRRLSLPCC